MSDSGHQSRTTTWRIAACLMFLGLTLNAIFGLLFATGVSTAVSYPRYIISQWFPPSTERLWPMLQAMRRLGIDTFMAFGYLAFSTVVSIVLAAGLWKMKKWAAWITTAIMLYLLVSRTYGIIRVTKTGLAFDQLVTFGWIPALVWSAAYLVLLWPDWMIGGLREAANLIKQLRRERLPVG